MLKRVNDRLAWEGECSLQPPRVALWQIIGIVSVCFLSQIIMSKNTRRLDEEKYIFSSFPRLSKQAKNQTSID